MKHIKPLIALFGIMTAAALMAATIPPVEEAHAAMCFKQYEYTSGMNKICVYDCLGSEAAITVQSYQLCPITINR